MDQTTLGPAETRVLQHLAAGHSLTNTAHLMGISRASVRTHTRRIYTKYGVTTRQDAIRTGRRLGHVTDTCPTCGHGGAR